MDMDNVWQPSELDDTRAAEYATVPLSPGSPGILREADQHEDISSLPSPQLSSPRREPGRPEIPIECRSENDSSLKILRETRKCTKGKKDRKHSCRDTWDSCTDEEFDQIQNLVDLAILCDQWEKEKTSLISKLQTDGFLCPILRSLRIGRERYQKMKLER